MNFSERPPSKQWAALMYRGEQFAEVWLKPEGQPLALTFRIPQGSFHMPGMGKRLTIENLLKAVGIAAAEVESWRDEGASHSGMSGAGSELSRPLPPPQGVTHLSLHVSLKPSPQAVVPDESRETGVEAPRESEIPEATWLFLADRWNAILGLEAGVESLRVSMEGLQTEMEAAARHMLPLDVKVNALNADVVQWNKAKSRIRYAIPKTRDFIHRATWATAAPERKKFAELFENHIQPRIPFPQIEEVLVQIEGLLKDRQTLYAQGATVYQECKSITADCQGALRTLQSNAASNASRKKGGTGHKGKSHRP